MLIMIRNTDISQVVNEELNAIINWFSANRLFLNVTKTKYLIINNQDRPPPLKIKIGDSLMFLNS